MSIVAYYIRNLKHASSYIQALSPYFSNTISIRNFSVYYATLRTFFTFHWTLVLHENASSRNYKASVLKNAFTQKIEGIITSIFSTVVGTNEPDRFKSLHTFREALISAKCFPVPCSLFNTIMWRMVKAFQGLEVITELQRLILHMSPIRHGIVLTHCTSCFIDLYHVSQKLDGHLLLEICLISTNRG